MSLLAVSDDPSIGKVVSLTDVAAKRLAERDTAIRAIRVAEINGESVRFYRGPFNEPDLPWVSLADIARVCGFDEKQTLNLFISLIKMLHGGGGIATVKAEDGEVYIVAMLVAVALFSREDLNELIEPFSYEASVVMDEMTKDLSDGLRFQFVIAASRGALEPPLPPEGEQA